MKKRIKNKRLKNKKDLSLRRPPRLEGEIHKFGIKNKKDKKKDNKK
jgi:hypothetical protein